MQATSKHMHVAAFQATSEQGSLTPGSNLNLLEQGAKALVRFSVLCVILLLVLC